MVRTRPPGRLDGILDAAVAVLQRVGFSRARMADIATAAGVSPGLLYQYAESKDALFHLALLREIGTPLDELPLPAAMPSATTFESALQQALRGSVRREALVAALASRRAPRDVRGEVEAIVGEHYDWVHSNRRLIRIIERSAIDRPALAAGFYDRGRGAFVDQLGRYIARRVKGGQFRPVPDAAVAARFVVESAAWFAMHRFGDHDGARIPDDTARATVVDLVASALVAEG